MARKARERKIAAVPQIDPAKEADIRRFLEISGATKSMADMIPQMTEQMKPLLEKLLPPGERKNQIVDTYVKKFAAKAKPEGLVNRVVSIYDKHLTHEDLKGLIQFYESPLGQRYGNVLPTLEKEAYTAGEQWGQEIGREVMREMRVEHPELRPRR